MRRLDVFVSEDGLHCRWPCPFWDSTVVGETFESKCAKHGPLETTIERVSDKISICEAKRHPDCVALD